MEDYYYIKAITKAVQKLNIKENELEDELIDHFSTKLELMDSQNEKNLEIIINQIESIDMRKWRKSSISKYSFIVLSIVLFSGFSFWNYEQNTNNQNDFVCQINNTESMEYFERIDLPPFGSPIDEVHISSQFGKRFHPIRKIVKFHHGIDLKAPAGTLIKVVEAGQVVDCGFDDKNGYYVEVKHDDIYTTRYHHMQEHSVKKGDDLQKGDIIGKVGSTGLSTAPHLHYEIIKSGDYVNPINYLKA